MVVVEKFHLHLWEKHSNILLHRFSAELRKAQQKKATGDGRITNFFQKVKDP
jgi:hypothetical protein